MLASFKQSHATLLRANYHCTAFSLKQFEVPTRGTSPVGDNITSPQPDLQNITLPEIVRDADLVTQIIAGGK